MPVSSNTYIGDTRTAPWLSIPRVGGDSPLGQSVYILTAWRIQNYGLTLGNLPIPKRFGSESYGHAVTRPRAGKRQATSQLRRKVVETTKCDKKNMKPEIKGSPMSFQWPKEFRLTTNLEEESFYPSLWHGLSKCHSKEINTWKGMQTLEKIDFARRLSSLSCSDISSVILDVRAGKNPGFK